tara:strand:- start:127 stop:414 length:288 start_codon:yes stop_codon:yes gene_type:complete
MAICKMEQEEQSSVSVPGMGNALRVSAIVQMYQMYGKTSTAAVGQTKHTHHSPRQKMFITMNQCIHTCVYLIAKMVVGVFVMQVIEKVLVKKKLV